VSVRVGPFGLHGLNGCLKPVSIGLVWSRADLQVEPVRTPKPTEQCKNILVFYHFQWQLEYRTGQIALSAFSIITKSIMALDFNVPFILFFNSYTIFFLLNSNHTT